MYVVSLKLAPRPGSNDEMLYEPIIWEKGVVLLLIKQSKLGHNDNQLYLKILSKRREEATS